MLSMDVTRMKNEPVRPLRSPGEAPRPGAELQPFSRLPCSCSHLRRDSPSWDQGLAGRRGPCSKVGARVAASALAAWRAVVCALRVV